MCGIAGYLGGKWEDGAAGAERCVMRMASAIAHRGPDSAGSWIDGERGIALAHRRLAIVELSDAGHQPMVSVCGRYVLVFNGEIYNHSALREELLAAGAVTAWRGHSDTETLLAYIAAHGLEAALKATVGMFAIALWDREKRVLHLARDRMGEKPLYYGWQRDTFLFASELKAMREHPVFEGEVDRDALTTLLRFNAIPAPCSIFRGISKLPPGTVLSVAIEGGQRCRGMDDGPIPYWSLKDAVCRGASTPFVGDEQEAVSALEARLTESIGQQMIADVPLGAFLSGGVDSSVVVALMQAQSERPVKTFTIGFHEKGYNEAEHAKAVAAHLGTEHTEFYVSPDEALELIPSLPTLYDEPFSDSSQIPTYLVSRITRQNVTVALSGDGGDELFGGYNRYLAAMRLWRTLAGTPLTMRRLLARMLATLPPSIWDGAGTLAGVAQASEKMRKVIDVMEVESPDALYRSLISHWKTPERIVVGGTEPAREWVEPEMFENFEERMMYLDATGYLPDDILVKMDRAAMGVSLETRVPLLDHRVVEFAWSLPLEMKIRHGEGKWLLRQVLYQHVPRELINRPKMGFGVPVGAWLRGPLREWAEALLDESRLRREGYLQPEPILRKWREHLAGRRNWQHHLWDVLMFQAWLAQWKGV